MLKYGYRDQSGKKKHKGKRAVANKRINGLSNKDIVKKDKFLPKDIKKVEKVLSQRGLVWE